MKVLSLTEQTVSTFQQAKLIMHLNSNKDLNNVPNSIV